MRISKESKNEKKREREKISNEFFLEIKRREKENVDRARLLVSQPNSEIIIGNTWPG